MRIRAGRRFIQAGHLGREVMVVNRGVASVHEPRTGVYLASVVAGEVCGELAVLTPGLRSADVVANTDMVVIVLSPAELAYWMDFDARFSHLILTQAAAHRNPDGPATWEFHFGTIEPDQQLPVERTDSQDSGVVREETTGPETPPLDASPLDALDRDASDPDSD